MVHSLNSQATFPVHIPLPDNEEESKTIYENKGKFMLGLNCIFFGHAGAGKSELILNLCGHININDDVEFERAYFSTNTARFNMLEVPSHCKYVPTLITRASGAHIGVLVISASENDFHSDIKENQTMEYSFRIKIFGITKIIVVVSKMDASAWSEKSFNQLKDEMSKFLGILGYDIEKDVKVIPVSSLSDSNVKTKVGEEKCCWWEGQSLLEALEAFEPLAYSRGHLRDALQKEKAKQNKKAGLGEDNNKTGGNVVHVAVEKFVKDLVLIDLRLDDDSTNGKLWFDRARSLYNDLRRFQDLKPDKGINKPEVSRELLVSRKTLGAFEAASKANPTLLVEKEEELLLWRILGDGYREEGNFKVARDYYEKCHDFAKGERKFTLAKHFHTLMVDTIIQQEEYEREELREKAEEKKKQKNSRKNKNRKERRRAKEEDEPKNEEDGLGNEDTQENAMGAKEEDEPTNEEDGLGNEDTQENAMGDGDEIEVVASASYKIKANREDTIYTGVMIMGNNLIELPKSFILCTSSQIENLGELVSFGSSDVNFLTIGDVVRANIGHEPSNLMVVESVRTVEYYFMCEFENFLKSHNWERHQLRNWSEEDQIEAMREWWVYIADKFFKIFRNVVHGLLHLYSKGLTCGNLSGEKIFVTDSVEGRILPSFDILKGSKEDLTDLSKIMKYIIYQPHLGLHVSRNYLPYEVKHLLDFLYEHRNFDIPSSVVDHPYFWTSAQRVSFIRKLRHLTRANVLMRKEAIDSHINRMMTETFPYYECWVDYLPEGVLQDICSKANGGDGGIVPYTIDFDIIRYFNAVFSHVNELEYAASRPKQVVNEVEMEEILRVQFPGIYVSLLDAVFHLAHAGLFMHLSAKEILKQLSSLSPC